jgi:hypothetical protein
LARAFKTQRIEMEAMSFSISLPLFLGGGRRCKRLQPGITSKHGREGGRERRREGGEEKKREEKKVCSFFRTKGLGKEWSIGKKIFFLNTYPTGLLMALV